MHLPLSSLKALPSPLIALRRRLNAELIAQGHAPVAAAQLLNVCCVLFQPAPHPRCSVGACRQFALIHPSAGQWEELHYHAYYAKAHLLFHCSNLTFVNQQLFFFSSPNYIFSPHLRPAISRREHLQAIIDGLTYGSWISPFDDTPPCCLPGPLESLFEDDCTRPTTRFQALAAASCILY